VTLFCRSQGGGKSCVAKLFSIFSWLENALVRGDFSLKYLIEYNRFVKEQYDYQKIKKYFNEDTHLRYHGSAFEMEYRNGKLNVFPMSDMDYLRP